jgi:hypothetical protein
MPVSITAALVLISLTPLGTLWFSGVAGLSPELLAFTRVPLLILSLSPVAVGMNAWFRGILITRARTPIVTKAMGVTLLTLALLLLLSVFLFPFPGVTSAAIAIMCSLAAQSIYLAHKTWGFEALRGQ